MKFSTIQAILESQGIIIKAKDDDEVTVGNLPIRPKVFSLNPKKQ